MLCAVKIDRHLGEQKLLEMATFLYAGRFDAYGTEASVPQHCGTFRHTAYRQCQSGHLLGMRCGTAENAGGASAPMLNDFTGADQVYIACGYTDLRLRSVAFSAIFAERPIMALIKAFSYSLAKQASRLTSYKTTCSKKSSRI